MKIEVTQDHIDRGRKQCRTGCPVALALEAEGICAAVGPAYISVYTGDENPVDYYCTPQKVTDFVHAFDDDKLVGPFSFYFTTDGEVFS